LGVFIPVIDHDVKTDLLVGDGTESYLIQIKTVESSNESHFVDHKWGDVNTDFVIYVSKTANWRYIAQPFTERRKD
jgi:hypothetical protein